MLLKVMCLAILATSAFTTSVVLHDFDSCSPTGFSCGDGGCVSADLVCDGEAHCANGNDEHGCDRALVNLSSYDPALHRSIRQISTLSRPQTGTCKLPEYPAHGTYATNIPNAKPGDEPDVVLISVTCQHGFVADGSTTITCFNGNWQNKMPECIPQCHLPSHPSVEYNCLVSSTVGGSRACKEYEPAGTVVSPQCRRPIYHSTTALRFMRCLNGKWDYVARCIPECGTVTSSGTPQVVGGVSAKHGEVPWHAGIYSKNTKPYLQICGGSLISTDVVLSAAHCFWSKGAKQPAASFAVAVGKLYRTWNDDMDEAQTSDVKEFHLPSRFLGSEANFQDDIAVVIVTRPFVYKTFIRPVCVDFDVLFEKRQLQPGKKGKVAGWGLKAVNGKPSQDLQVIELPYVSTDTCILESPPLFSGYITSDKMCAGFKEEGKAVCMGDSGGGLVFPESDKGTQRYYLRGIVSTAPDNNDLCNVNFYTAFTQIQSHANFIKEFWLAAGYLNADDGSKRQQKVGCILPPHPAHGTYEVTNVPHAKPGDTLDFIEFNVTCDEGYAVNGTSSGYCFNGMWRTQVPECVGLPCKEELLKQYVVRTMFYPMDDVSLNHYGTRRRNSTGHLTYFEIHFALQTHGDVVVHLTEFGAVYTFSNINCVLFIGDDGNQRTNLYTPAEPEVQHFDTPDILSATEYRAFFIKIVDGKVQFGKEGDSTPLISYSGTDLGFMNYYYFGVRNNGTAKIRYCPSAFKGSS